MTVRLQGMIESTMNPNINMLINSKSYLSNNSSNSIHVKLFISYH